VPDREVPILLGLEWDSRHAWVSLNGVRKNVTSRANTTVNFGTNIMLGITSSTANRPSSVYSVVFFDRTLTDKERAYLTDRGAWGWNSLTETDGEVTVGYEATENHILNPQFDGPTDGWVYN